MASHCNFAFQKAGWPGWHEAAGKEAGLSYSDARTAYCCARRGLESPVRTIELQRSFAHRVTAVEALKAAQRASLAELDALFATLQHRAFCGEL